MKYKIFIILGLLVLASIKTHSQEARDTIKLWTRYPGYIITNDGDTIYGNLLLKNKVANQGKVFFFENEDSEEPIEKYRPRDIKGYNVADRIYETKKYTPENTAMRYCFLLKTIDGPVCLYKAYYDDKQRIKINEENLWQSKIDLSFSEDELKEQRLACREGEDLVKLDGTKYLLNFKKNMSKYLSDCPQIAEKIANKEDGYKWIDLEKIIREYNEWKLNNH